MKAIVYYEYGSPDVLRMEEIEKPTPGDSEVLIKIYAAAVNSADWRLMKAEPFLVRMMGTGLLRPKNPILGADVAGRVEAIGQKVKQFRPGDEVYGDLSGHGNGGFAEYVAVDEEAMALKPANLTFEQAAAVPMAAVTALQGLRDVGQIQPGQQVLIHGASGGVGTFAVQIAKAFGAEVTAVCSTTKVELVRTLGADHVIDYTQEDFTRNGQQYDLILAVNGYRSLADYQQALKPQGIYVMAGGSTAPLFQALLFGRLLSRKGGRTINGVSAKPNQKDLIFMKELIEAGKVMPVIDRCYPLNEVPEAIGYVSQGHARGKVVITPVLETQPG